MSRKKLQLTATTTDLGIRLNAKLFLYLGDLANPKIETAARKYNRNERNQLNYLASPLKTLDYEKTFNLRCSNFYFF
jgi:hypothetical protein